MEDPAVLPLWLLLEEATWDAVTALLEQPEADREAEGLSAALKEALPLLLPLALPTAEPQALLLSD